jgi:SAM-dependent methyltransferase
MTSYTVAACARCGFLLARDLPTDEEYERYYRGNLKYTYEGQRNAADALFAMHAGSFEMVHRYLTSEVRETAVDTRIVDIGCSTGEFLALFKRHGYRRLHGIDPTPECRQIAQQLHGIEIETAVLSESAPDEPYDVVLLANVLEHIPNLADAVDRVSRFVRKDGLLFVQVPCAEHFGADMREPFLEFSIEHINYFTTTSLANLLRPIGFEPVEIRHDVLQYKRAFYPVITSLWKNSGAWAQTMMRSDTAPVRHYIAASNAVLGDVGAKIDLLVASAEPVVVWGVGSLTARLLATTNLGRANITAFVDSNSGLQGKPLLGRKIEAPATLRNGTGTVLVSSFVYGSEIRDTLEKELGYAGRIVTI